MEILTALSQLTKERDNILNDIEQYESIESVIDYKKALQRQDELELMIKTNLEAFSPELDKLEFVPGRKKGEEVYWEGQIGVIRKKKTTRKIISERFVAQFPFLAGKLAKFTLKDVEPEITKEEFESVIVREDSITYTPTSRTVPATTKPLVEKKKKTKTNTKVKAQ